MSKFHLLTIAAIIPLMAGQSVYPVEEQAVVWNVPAQFSFQSGQDQVPVPKATLTPTSPANIRNLPATKGSDIVGQAAKGSSYPVLGFVTRDDGQWYYLSLPEGGYGWVRSDVVPAPVGDDVWDLTDVAALSVVTDETQPAEQLIDASVNLALVQSAFDTLMNRGVPADSFTPDNLELIAIQGQNLIFRLKNTVQGNEAGTVLAIVANGDALQAVESFRPGQLRDILSQNGVAADGAFSAANTPEPYVRFGSTVLFNYEQAVTQLSQGTSVGDTLLASIVVTDTPFPAALFSISKTDTGTQMVFTEGQAYDLSQNEGENFLRAKKLDITVMTPGVVAAQLNLPQGSYTFDTNIYYGPNKMLKDASGNVVAVSTATADAWQTVDTIVASMNLDTKAEDGSDLYYYFDTSDPLNLFLREKRDLLHQRGIIAMLDETDGTWQNFRTPAILKAVINNGYAGSWKDTDYNRQNVIFFRGIGDGVRKGVHLAVSGTDRFADNVVRIIFQYFPNRQNIPGGEVIETSLIMQHLEGDGPWDSYNDWSGIVEVASETKGIEISAYLPLKKGNQIWGNADSSKFLREYMDNNQEILTALGNGEVIHDPLVFILYNLTEPTIFTALQQ